MDVHAVDTGVRGVEIECECFVGVAGKDGFSSGQRQGGEESHKIEDLRANSETHHCLYRESEQSWWLMTFLSRYLVDVDLWR